jgi:hypothetical protein
VVEQALFFAIGFLVASLAALIAAPLISRRAFRLAEARARMQAPVTERQAAADRAALIAVHAVEQMRLEHRIALAEETTATVRAAGGRQAARLIALEADTTEREGIIFDHLAEISKMSAERREFEVAASASQMALHDAFAQRDRAQVREAAAKARQDELESEASRDRARIAILMARAESLQSRIEDLPHRAEAAKETAEKSIAELVEPSPEGSKRTMRVLERRLGQAMGPGQGQEAEQEQARAGLTELELRLQVSEHAREEALVESGRQLKALAEREAALRAAQEKILQLEARLAATNEKERASERAASTHADAPGADQAARQGSPPVASNDAELRASIQYLGREVSRLFASQKRVKGDDARKEIGWQDRETSIGIPNAEARDLDLAEGPGRRVAQSRAPGR